MTSSKFVVAALAMSISATALGAGAHGGGHGHGANNGEPGKASDVSRSITVEMYDNYYEPEEIEVTPGETVRFVVENKGKLVHEFNIGTPAMHEAHQKEMMMMVEHGIIQGGKLNHEMMEMDMGNGQSMKHDDRTACYWSRVRARKLSGSFPRKAILNLPATFRGTTRLVCMAK